MSSVNGVQGTQGAQTATDRYADLGTEDFLKLLVTELQNQDPMNPMDNKDMMEQINQIRQIQSNTQLTQTMEAVQLNQNLGTAASLIGHTVTALTDPDASGDQSNITGVVDRVSVVDGVPKLIIGDQTIDLKNLSAIVADASAASG